MVNTWRCVSATCRWSRGAAARAGREWHPGHPEAQQRDHLAGTQGERRTPAQAGDEDQDEDQQGGGGETSEAQTGEGEAGHRLVYSGATTTSDYYCSCCVEGTRFNLIGCTESIRYRRYDPLCGIVTRLNNLKARRISGSVFWVSSVVSLTVRMWTWCRYFVKSQPAPQTTDEGNKQRSVASLWFSSWCLDAALKRLIFKLI